MSNGDNFAAISHWLIEPRMAVSSGDRGVLGHMVVAADSAAAAARQYAERWRMSRPYAITGPFTDQQNYVVRRLPDHAVDEPQQDAGVVHSELLRA